jgi:hypothetical protein
MTTAAVTDAGADTNMEAEAAAAGTTIATDADTTAAEDVIAATMAERGCA